LNYQKLKQAGVKLIVLEIVLYIFGAYLTLYAGYNIFLIFVNYFMQNKFPKDFSYEKRFLIIIPAHNEELFIGRVLSSLLDQNYPSKIMNICVVADNCNDKTAEIAKSFSVNVIVRESTTEFGKGHAIKYALDNIKSDYEAAFIIDADSILDKEGLSCLNQHILRGKSIIQCNNAVANTSDSWFTQLMHVSRTIGNEIQEPAKEKLGLSSHLMGNGMCFDKRIIERYGWSAFTVGEDWEYYAKIINEGERIAFAQDVHVYHQESTSFEQATPQRMRWASGRFAILWRYGLKLFVRGILEKNMLKFDASLPLVFPNPSLAINLTIGCFLLSILVLFIKSTNFLLYLYGYLILIQLLVFLAGVMYTKDKMKSFMSIFIAPFFLIWKLGIDLLAFLGFGRKHWIRTKRHM
jgi:cellulose synthase/poly-beta-1,6-N-acetylglucosamine synthase-like glycosyltransferase